MSLGTLVVLGKYQFPETDPGVRQQALRFVIQSRGLSSSPMSSRVTRLLFGYVVPLSENSTSLASETGKYVMKNVTDLNING